MPSSRFGFIGSVRDTSPLLLGALARLGTLEAVCDASEGGDAIKTPARWTFASVSALLREARPDGVVVEQSLEERPQIIRQCLESGAAVLVVGSPGPAAACKRLTTVANLSGRVVLASPAVRFSPAMLLACRLAESGKLAAPIAMTFESSRRGDGADTNKDKGKGSRSISFDQVYEGVYLAFALVGALRRVFAVANEDGVLIVAMESATGTPVSMTFYSQGPVDAEGISLEVRAVDGMRLEIDRNLQATFGDGSRIEASHRFSLAGVEPAVELGYEGLVVEFVRRMHRSPQQVGGGLDGLAWNAMVVAEAIAVSAERRKVVEVRYSEACKSEKVGRRKGGASLPFPD